MLNKIKAVVTVLREAFRNAEKVRDYAKQIRDFGYMLADARALLLRFEAGIDSRDKLIAEMRAELSTLRQRAEEAETNLAVAVDRLELIAEKETPSANATVRRITRIVRETISDITGKTAA